MNEWIPVVVAFCISIAPTITAWAAYKQAKNIAEQNRVIAEKVSQIHKETNSMKDALVEATKSDSFQKGKTEGLAERFSGGEK